MNLHKQRYKDIALYISAVARVLSVSLALRNIQAYHVYYELTDAGKDSSSQWQYVFSSILRRDSSERALISYESRSLQDARLSVVETQEYLLGCALEIEYELRMHIPALELRLDKKCMQTNFMHASQQAGLTVSEGKRLFDKLRGSLPNQ